MFSRAQKLFNEMVFSVVKPEHPVVPKLLGMFGSHSSLCMSLATDRWGMLAIQSIIHFAIQSVTFFMFHNGIQYAGTPDNHTETGVFLQNSQDPLHLS